MRTTVTARGQTVVPAKIRRDHAIEPETRLEWIDDGQTIRVVPIPRNPIAAAIGITQGFGEKLLVERRRDRDRDLSISYVLDTSAIVTLTDREEGWEEVELLLHDTENGSGEAMACAISLMELYYLGIRETGEDAATNLIALVKSWPIAWLYPDEKTFLLAAWLKASNSLSVADAIIAATAKLRNAVLVHKDPELAALASEVRLKGLPYKNKAS